jgi:hypothetical protein
MPQLYCRIASLLFPAADPENLKASYPEIQQK